MSSGTVAVNRHEKELFGHPIGLYILFLTECWERFSYYGMRAILVLYLVEKTTSANPGLGWTNGHALELYGWYTMLVYVACIPGGLIADNLLGQKRTVLWGGIILVLGHSILAIEATWAFYSGLVLIVIGVGMLKANISTMVGGLYKKGDIRRDKGFTIFYMGINLGALLAAFTVGYVGEKIGWHYGFGMAGIAMAVGLVIYIWGQRYLKKVGNKPEKKQIEEDGEKDVSMGELFGELFRSPTQLIITAVLVVFSIFWGVSESWSYGLLFLFLSIVVGMVMMIYKDLTTQKMKDRFMVIILSFLLVIVFWGAFEQAGGLMSIYAAEKTNRMLSFSLPLIGNEIPATWFQALNSIFILIFGVWVANYWAKRKLKNKEASSIFKMAIGTIIMGLGFIFMAGAANQYVPGGEKAAMYWLVLAFLLQTIGELCSSPVSLSFITKLSPVKYASLMMGLYFAATGLGNKMAGTVGEASQSEPVKIELATTNQAEILPFLQLKKVEDNPFKKESNFTINSEIYLQDGELQAINPMDKQSVLPIIQFMSQERKKEVVQTLKENAATAEKPYHADFIFKKLDEPQKIAQHKLGYEGSFIIKEVQTEREFKTFIGITIFTGLFGLLVILLLKPLKRLTHGVEDDEHEMTEEELITE